MKKTLSKKKINQTGIEFLRYYYKNDYEKPNLFDKAEEKQMITMNEFSKWLSDKGWNMADYGGDWYYGNNNKESYTFSRVYELFLESRK